MAKRKPEVKILSYGVYTRWNSDSKELPKIKDFATRVRAVIDVEFGFIVNIKSAKNEPLKYCIDHPGILDANGMQRAPFEGVEYVKSNDWHFYLGDTIWEPVADKLGDWRMTLELADKIVAEKTFQLYDEPDDEN